MWIFILFTHSILGKLPEMRVGKSYTCNMGFLNMFVSVGQNTLSVSKIFMSTAEGGILFYVDDYGNIKLYRGIIEGKEVFSKIIKNDYIKNNINFIYDSIPFACIEDNRVKTYDNNPMQSIQKAPQIIEDGIRRIYGQRNNYDACEETTIKLEEYGEILYEYQQKRKYDKLSLEYLKFVQNSLFNFKNLYKKMNEYCDGNGNNSSNELPSDINELEKELDKEINLKLQ